MDVRKLYSLILKSNPNITELFLKPVYINMKPEFRVYRNLFYSLNPEINSDAEKVWQIDRFLNFPHTYTYLLMSISIFRFK